MQFWAWWHETLHGAQAAWIKGPSSDESPTMRQGYHLLEYLQHVLEHAASTQTDAEDVKCEISTVDFLAIVSAEAPPHTASRVKVIFQRKDHATTSPRYWQKLVLSSANLLWWLIFMQPAMRGLSTMARIDRPSSQPADPDEASSGPSSRQYSLDRPIYGECQNDERLLGLVTAVIRAFSTQGSSSSQGFLHVRPLMVFLYSHVIKLTNTRHLNPATIKLVAKILTDDRYPYAHVLHRCALCWADGYKMVQLPIETWPQFDAVNPNVHQLLPPSCQAETSTMDTVVKHVMSILVAGVHTIQTVQASLGITMSPPPPSPSDPVATQYIQDYLQMENLMELTGKEWLLSDKYQPFRRHGASLAFVSAHARSQPPSTTEDVDEWTTWLLRMILVCGFGWGCREQMLQILNADLSSATATHQWWAMTVLNATKEEQQVFFSVKGYGQVIWPTLGCDTLITQALDLAKALAGHLITHASSSSKQPKSFASSMEAFCRPSPPGTRKQRRSKDNFLRNFPPQGLLPWLLLCDISSRCPDLQLPPTLDDLVVKIHNGAGGLGESGPWKALQHLFLSQSPTCSQIRIVLQQLSTQLQPSTPSFGLFSNIVPVFGMEDLEHMLCKVARDK